MGKFAEKLKELMKEKDLSQSALARMAGIKQPSVNNILNNKTIPTIETVLKLASALTYDPGELITLSLYDEAPPAAKIYFTAGNTPVGGSILNGAGLDEVLFGEGLTEEDIFEVKQFVNYRKWMRGVVAAE
jgi:transcriptional regulator with XRE-family HTH domain